MGESNHLESIKRTLEERMMTELEKLRKQKDEFFKSDPHSPLSKAQKRAFKGLNYYPENLALRFDAQVEPFAEHVHVQMQTSTGDVQNYVKYRTLPTSKPIRRRSLC
jgi:uncharacterized protein (DUF1684 family)